MTANEIVNRDLLSKCLEQWDTLSWSHNHNNPESKQVAQRILTETSEDNRHRVIYHSDDVAPFPTREYVTGVGIQKLVKEIRNTICRDTYNDYDIVNCHISILLNLVERYPVELPHKFLRDFYTHRQEWIDEAVSIHKCQPDEVKQQAIYAIDGGVMRFMTPRYASLLQEINQIKETLYKDPDYEPIRLFVESKKKDNLVGTFMAHLLQHFEAGLLTESLKWLQMKGIPIDSVVRMFDGFMLEKKYPIDLTELTAHLTKTTSIKVEIINKPMLNGFDFTIPPPKLTLTLKPTRNDKHIDEKYVLSLLTKIVSKNKKGVDVEKTVIDERRTVEYLNQFLWLVSASKPYIIEFTDRTEKGVRIHARTRSLREDIFATIDEFFLLWLKSPNKNVINGVHYEPYLIKPQNVRPDIYNPFQGFKHTRHTPYDPNHIVKMELVEPWIDLIRHNWCDDVPKLFEYVIRWFAHKIQRPKNKLVSTIVITSLLEGIGKNTFFDFFIKHVIGAEFGVLVGSIDELLEKFNDHYEMSLIICCDELRNKGNQFEQADALKKIVVISVWRVILTEPTIIRIGKKCTL
jgi:hypothetical protein